jgi:hypothetical protein
MTRYILALDPSGNYNEGKGTTGWCLYDTHTNKIVKFGIIKAIKYNRQEDYWRAHLDLMDGLIGYGYTLVVEDYMLYSNRATSQINSRFETPKLIGVIQYECYVRGIRLEFQTASAVKLRWSNDILVHKNIIKERQGSYWIMETKLSEHCLDSIRHAIHYATFGNR